MSFRHVLSGLAVLVLFACIGQAGEPVTVHVQTAKPGAEISEDALGLSYETSLMLPDAKGVRYFRPDNRPLIQMFRTLGIQSLRIGGNSVDAAGIPIPTEDDIRSLFEFARAADVKVIYSVRLEGGDPQSAAAIAKFIRKHYAKQLDCFAIGNEPKGYYKDTNVFLAKWSAVRDAMVAEWPRAKFCGPDDNPSVPWCRMMVQNFGAPAGPLIQISQHSYSFGCSYTNPGEKDVTKLVLADADAARGKMLSPDAYAIYEKIYKGIRISIGDAPISFRLSEVNSFWFSGLKGASDSHASALWAVDYAHWWSQRGADGLNFHTGDRTGGAINLPCRYAAFVTSSNGYEAQPLAYGLKLFSAGSQGKILPVVMDFSTNQNITAYATLSGRKTVLVTVLNKDYGPAAKNVDVRLQFSSRLAGKPARALTLSAQNNDIAATAGQITLGGDPIHSDGSWGGKWAALPLPGRTNAITLNLPPATAAVVEVRLR